MVLKEHRTHYSDKKYCERLWEEVIVEQMKTSGLMIVKYKYINLNRCDVTLSNPRVCPLNIEKLIEKTEE